MAVRNEPKLTIAELRRGVGKSGALSFTFLLCFLAAFGIYFTLYDFEALGRMRFSDMLSQPWRVMLIFLGGLFGTMFLGFYARLIRSLWWMWKRTYVPDEKESRAD